ncbi:MAG: PEP-CTERM sorting domain-containing protein [Opitutaceae bacterium]|nr:PEP-CTERM sorting domain-containing protein [Opitutaceae bacterium]
MENALQIYVNQPQGSTSLSWNDIYRSTSTVDTRGYLVEFSVIPEPSTYALFVGLATLGLVSYRRFRRR